MDQKIPESARRDNACGVPGCHVSTLLRWTRAALSSVSAAHAHGRDDHAADDLDLAIGNLQVALERCQQGAHGGRATEKAGA